MPEIPVEKGHQSERSMTKRSKILARRGNTYIPVSLKDVAFFYSSQRIVFAVDFNGNKFIVDYTLSQIEHVVDHAFFFRVNRNMILHIEAIREFKIIEYGKITIHLISAEWIKEEIQVSQYTAPQFREWISNL